MAMRIESFCDDDISNEDFIQTDEPVEPIPNEQVVDSEAEQPEIISIFDDSQRSVDNEIMRLKSEKEALRKALYKNFVYLGDQIVDSDSENESSCDDQEEFVSPVNTRHYQIDDQFAPNYYFITNVCSRYLKSESSFLGNLFRN